jgi:hypothetical protein
LLLGLGSFHSAAASKLKELKIFKGKLVSKNAKS